jgi:hypothetical protein
MRHQFVGFFGRCIEADRMVDRGGGAERQLRVRAIDRGGRGVDQVLAAIVPAAFQDVLEAPDIRVDIDVGMAQRVTHARLRSQVDHAREAFTLEQAGDARPIGKIKALEPETGLLLEDRETSVLDLGIVVVVDIVEADDRPARRQQALGDMEADETGATRDEDLL